MEIRLPPDREAHLAALAASVGRNLDEIVLEGVALWEEQENARVRAARRSGLDDASIRRGEGTEITHQSIRKLAEDVNQHGRERLATEPKHTSAEAVARILELRKGNLLPEGVTIKDLINHGRA